MSIRILRTSDGTEVMYESVTMRAFGPVFDDDTLHYGLDDFIYWLKNECNVTNAKWYYDTNIFHFERCYQEWLKEMKEAHQ